MPDTLATLVRAKHPGAYDDMSDTALEAAVIAKFPGVYDDLPRTAASARLGITPPVGGKGVTIRPDGYSVDRGMAGSEWRPNSGVKERDRPDNTLLGMPPELVIAGAAGPVRAVAQKGLSMAQRGVAGAKALAGQAVPYAKFEVTKHGLEAVGVPSAIATPIAFAVSGYRGRLKGGKAAPNVPDEAIAPASADARASERMVSGMSAKPAAVSPPVASAPVPAVPPARSGGAESAPASPAASMRPPMSAQRIRNEVGLAARRSNLKLTEPELAQADGLVREGLTPVQAVKQVGGQTAATPAASAPTASSKPPKMTAAETREYVALRSKGKTHQEAAEVLQAQRELAKRFGTPSPEDARKAVQQRNKTGRWGDRGTH